MSHEGGFTPFLNPPQKGRGVERGQSPLPREEGRGRNRRCLLLVKWAGGEKLRRIFVTKPVDTSRGVSEVFPLTTKISFGVKHFSF